LAIKKVGMAKLTPRRGTASVTVQSKA